MMATALAQLEAQPAYFRSIITPLRAGNCLESLALTESCERDLPSQISRPTSRGFETHIVS